jgi:hypothetical protein
MKRALRQRAILVKARLVSRETSSLADAKPTEQRIEHVFCARPPDEPVESGAGQP